MHSEFKSEEGRDKQQNQFPCDQVFAISVHPH